MIEWLKSRFASPKPKPRKQIDSIVAGIMDAYDVHNGKLVVKDDAKAQGVTDSFQELVNQRARKLWEEQRIDHEPIAGKEMAKPS